MTLLSPCPALAGLTHIGCVRQRNEDALFFGQHPGSPYWLAVVADGMGGHAGGDVASRMAVDTFRDAWRAVAEEVPGESWLSGLAEMANTRIAERAAEDPSLHRMGTTLVCLLLGASGVQVVHAGDSRAYRISGEGITQLTRDHTVAQEMVDNGSMTEEQAARSPVRHYLTRSLGVEQSVLLDSVSCPLVAGDTFLLCSDGLSNMVRAEEMLAMHGQCADPELLCQRLLDLALERGAPDNVSVVVCRV